MKIEIIDNTETEKHDIWKSEIRVGEDKAVGKLLKHFKNPKGANKRGKDVVERMRKHVPDKLFAKNGKHR
ncbi:MAG: hypothetical protein N2V72_00115 [Methanophagales archaeon]|nr:hypothetical protein [Methanophagales archaeon]